MPFLGESSILFGGFTGPTAGYVPAGAIWLDGSADYLTWTPSGAGDSQRTFTLSAWVKPINPSFDNIMSCGTTGTADSDNMALRFTTNGALQHGAFPTTNVLITSAYHRDPTAWMHVVGVCDTTDGTATNRLKLYVNGVEVTAFATDNRASNPTLNEDMAWGRAIAIQIGRDFGGGAPTAYYEGYMAEVIYLDGVAAAVTDLGKFDTKGNWVPIDPSGLTFGTNGFWLDFSNSAALGTDASANGNNFTVNSMSSANSTSDRPADDAENDLGNYNTVSTLFTREVSSYSSPAGSITTSNANLTVDFQNGGTNPLCITTQVLQPGKKYHFEWTTDVWGSDAITYVSVWLFPEKALKNTTDINVAGVYHYGIYTWNPSRGVGSSTNFNGSSLTSISASDAWGVGEVLSLDIDMSTVGSTTVVAKLDGVTLATDSSLAFLDEPYVICPQVQSNAANRTWKGTFNFGASAFATTPLTDHVGVYTSILPAPTVTDPSAYFQSLLYTGTGAELAVTGFTDGAGNNITPDFVWVKDRDFNTNHQLVDAVRGATYELNPNLGNTESTVAQGVKSFDSGGFTLGTDAGYNDPGTTYVAWCLKAGGAGSSNTDGSTTSTVSVAAHGGFSIGTYPGTGSAATVGHGLSRAPEWVIVKMTAGTGTQNWTVFQKNIFDGASNAYIILNLPDASTSGASFSSTAPTASVFSVGNDATNQSSSTFVFYAFAKTPGFIASGKYTGNGSTDGPYVVVDDGGSGFRPAFVLIKNSSNATGYDWQIVDATRDPYNPANKNLSPNLITAEGSGLNIDFTANGFKPRVSSNSVNASGNTYIYLAFAEYPFGGDGVAQAKAR